jgi:hypothetical protein
MTCMCTYTPIPIYIYIYVHTARMHQVYYRRAEADKAEFTRIVRDLERVGSTV